MRRIRDSLFRALISGCLAVVGAAHSSMAIAGCEFQANACFGPGALMSLTSGWYNTAVGHGAARLTTSGYSNTATGAFALAANTTASNNTATGRSSLQNNSTGQGNTANGAYSLYNNTTGSYNTAGGLWSLSYNTTGTRNTATGYRALERNTTGNFNTAVGSEALISNTVGMGNTSIGYWALSKNTGAGYGTATGYQALQQNTTGQFNTATGAFALQTNTTGGYNSAAGYMALQSNTTGNYNTAQGHSALRMSTTGFRNVALGHQAGYAVSTGSDNIIIGSNNQGYSTDNGVIRIGASQFQKKAFIAGIRGVTTTATGAVAVLIDANGQLGTINSSRRLKEDIQPMGSVSERLFALRPVSFRYKQAYEDGSKPVQFGLVAEEVAEVFPELVVYGKDGKPETVAYHVLATLLLNELQKERQLVEELRLDKDVQAARMAALERQVAILAQAVERADKSRMVAATQ